SITIPKSVSMVGDNAFNGCAALKHVKYSKKATTVAKNAFEDCPLLKK
ncbi:MAG: leucine-rich repeat protein, partial [Alistipes sp.]|nr:leucine-rich repeat protein [Alistipes sp.]